MIGKEKEVRKDVVSGKVYRIMQESEPTFK